MIFFIDSRICKSRDMIAETILKANSNFKIVYHDFSIAKKPLIDPTKRSIKNLDNSNNEGEYVFLFVPVGYTYEHIFSGMRFEYINHIESWGYSHKIGSASRSKPYDVNAFSSVISSHRLLNSEIEYMTWGMFKNLKFETPIFIRPLTGNKLFNGVTIKNSEDLWIEKKTIDQEFHICDSDLICVSEFKDIEPIEYRFWIVNHEVATYAPYSLHENTDGHKVPDYVNSWVKDWIESFHVNSNELVLDFTVDIAILKNNQEPKIIEINAISSSGWYKGMQPELLLSKIFTYNQ